MRAPDIVNFLTKMEARLGKKIVVSERRIKNYVHEYVGEASDAIIKGIDKMFEEKEKKDSERHDYLKGEINIIKTEHRELKKRVSVLESQNLN